MNDSPETLDRLVDEWLTVPDIADRLGLDASKVRRIVQERRIIGVRRGDPRIFYVPGAFLVPGHLANPAQPTNRDPDLPWAVLASLQGTLTVLSDAGFTDEAAIKWLFTPDDSLPGTPIDALRAGRKTEIRRRAAAEL
ncbi:helix-turn-helix domain-containing protein [Cellulomonas humilata]|uniref:Helix-turn-helix domain-containing protein n=1 Tax=Cellulomonas humilata TaxID=144055 RepID=A0A7Y6A2Y7_9CELL|nr:helix-turn-helix domain-containing protein [Cellulomonas humilata]